MKLEVLHVGSVSVEITKRIQQIMLLSFPNTTCSIADAALPLPERAFDKKRGQYNSKIILGKVRRHASKLQNVDCVLGIVDTDIFVSGLNFVFGEATCPGKAALISLWRLRPEFYHASSNIEVFLERAAKEAVHEVGHTMGLEHCPRLLCVMHFSNSIFDADRKLNTFCDRCGVEVALRLVSQNGRLLTEYQRLRVASFPFGTEKYP